MLVPSGTHDSVLDTRADRAGHRSRCNAPRFIG